MQVLEQKGIFNAMKNMFRLLESVAVIAQAVKVEVALEEPLQEEQEIMQVRLNPLLVEGRVVLQDHLDRLVEALIQGDQVEVEAALLRLEFLHKNNIKKYLL